MPKPEPAKVIDALAFAKKRQEKLESEHLGLQRQFTVAQQTLNEIGGKIALIQGRIAENAETLEALKPPTAAPPQEEPQK